MASSSLATLQGLLVDRVAAGVSDTSWTATKQTQQINAALRQVALEYDWPWLQSQATITTAASTRAYPVPTNWLRTVRLTETVNGTKIRLATIGQVDSVPSTTTGTPDVFAVWGNSIHFAPTPAEALAYQHRYSRLENTLSLSTDTPLVPIEFEEGAIEYAAYLALRFLREPARAQEALSAYKAWKERAIDNVRQARGTLSVQHRPGAWL